MIVSQLEEKALHPTLLYAAPYVCCCSSSTLLPPSSSQADDCIYFSSIFGFFNSCVFSLTPRPHFSPTFPILRDLELGVKSAHTYALLGCTKVLTNLPIPPVPVPPPPLPNQLQDGPAHVWRRGGVSVVRAWSCASAACSSVRAARRRSCCTVG